LCLQRINVLRYRNLENFLSSTQITTLFFDNELRIKLFTPATTRLFKLLPSDVERSISDFRLNLLEYALPADAVTIVRDGGTIEREVQHVDGSTYFGTPDPTTHGEGPGGRRRRHVWRCDNPAARPGADSQVGNSCHRFP
jgi:hypothetical protein